MNIFKTQQDSTSDIEKTSSLKTNKVIGYGLLTGGVLAIIVPVFLISSVLTGKSKPPQVFDVEAPTFEIPLSADQLEIPGGSKTSSGLSMTQSGSQKAKIIPDEVFNTTLNISLYYLLMLFITSAGSKIAGIGTKLVRDIKIKSS
ncbi:MAG: hypothetical protein WD988_04145 [Candidatus Curtissbacteria bacterium]